MAESTADRQTRFQRGADAYRSGRYPEARWHWESLWHDEDGAEHRLFLQALIQLASAMQKIWMERELRAAEKLLDLAVEKLSRLPAVYGGVALGELLRAAVDCREVIATLPSGPRAVLDAVHPPPLADAGTPLPWSKKRAAPPKIPVEGRQAHFQDALAAYGAGHFYEAHELWEDLWRDEVDAFHRNFLQGLIQVAASMHKLLRMHGSKGAIHLLGRAEARLHDVPDGYSGLAMSVLLDDVRRARAAATRLAEQDRTDLDPSLVPRITRHAAPKGG